MTDLDPSIASTATNGVFTQGPTNGVTITFDHSFITITGVTSLAAIANGGLGGLPVPPGGAADVLLNGELVIDINDTYTFAAGSYFHMGPNAKITVLGGNTLNFVSYINFKSCNQPWNTIEVMDGATLAIDRTQGNQACTPCELEIQDAAVAVTARDGASVTAKSVKFRNNGVGIQVPSHSGGNSVTLDVTDNLFSINSTSQLPGFAGLDLHDLGFAIVGRNTYENMNYGIYGTNTNLFTLYDEFRDLDFAGIAMTGNGHILYQVGKGNSLATPTFSNISTGVRTLGMSVYVSENGMNNVTSGVRSYTLNNKDVFVFNNTIAAKNNGVLVSSLRPLNYSTIENNTITMDGNADGRGINSISTKASGGSNYVRIWDNVVNLFVANSGVDMMTNSGVDVMGNHVNINDQTDGTCMAVDGGGQNHLLGNYLNGSSTSTLQNAIEVSQSSQGEYGCNHIDGTRIGLWFGSANMGSDIAGNSFSNYRYGLQVGNAGSNNNPNLGGYTGTQSHRGNMWLTTPATGTGWGAVHYSQIFDEVQNSQHEVDGADGANLITTEKTFVQGASFFVPLPGNTYTCPTNLTGSSPSDHLGSIEQGLASGTTTIGTFAAENWTARRQLYRLLKANPSLAPQGSVYATFLSNEANSTVGKFEDLQTAADAMLQGNANDRSQLAGYMSSTQTKFGEAKTIEDGLIAQPSNASLLAQRSAKQSEIVSVVGQSQALEQTMLAARVSAASQLLATNAAIATNSTYEANQKTTNRILLETIANDQLELTAQQVADLTPIAVECPYEGGEGVYAARALLGNEAVYYDFAACGLSNGNDGQQIKAPEVETPAGSSFTIYPNPANGYTVVQLDKKLENASSLTLTNTLGVQVLAEKLLEGTEVVPLDTANLPAGTYFLTLQTITGKQSRIFVISR